MFTFNHEDGKGGPTAEEAAGNRQAVAELRAHIELAESALALMRESADLLAGATDRAMTDGEQVALVLQADKAARAVTPLTGYVNQANEFGLDHIAHGCRLGTALIEALGMTPEKVERARGFVAARNAARALQFMFGQGATLVPVPKEGGGQ